MEAGDNWPKASSSRIHAVYPSHTDPKEADREGRVEISQV